MSERQSDLENERSSFTKSLCIEPVYTVSVSGFCDL